MYDVLISLESQAIGRASSGGGGGGGGSSSTISTSTAISHQ
jgi:hypothetical protein